MIPWFTVYRNGIPVLERHNTTYIYKQVLYVLTMLHDDYTTVLILTLLEKFIKKNARAKITVYIHGSFALCVK